MNEEAVLLEARLLLMMQYVQTYQRNAIFNGDWDRGRLIKNKINEVRERFSHIPLTIEYCVVPPDE